MWQLDAICVTEVSIQKLTHVYILNLNPHEIEYIVVHIEHCTTVYTLCQQCFNAIYTCTHVIPRNCYRNFRKM